MAFPQPSIGPAEDGATAAANPLSGDNAYMIPLSNIGAGPHKFAIRVDGADKLTFDGQTLQAPAMTPTAELNLPRLTTAERQALTPAADKAPLVFDTTLEQLAVWDGTAWLLVSSTPEGE